MVIIYSTSWCPSCVSAKRLLESKDVNYEEINIDGIFKQTYQILYAGILSGGFAFVLQIYAQKNITPTPAAIIFSLEGVIATVAAWFLLSQILNLNNIIGCIFIILGVLISQIVPELKINKVKQNQG